MSSTMNYQEQLETYARDMLSTYWLQQQMNTPQSHAYGPPAPAQPDYMTNWMNQQQQHIAPPMSPSLPANRSVFGDGFTLSQQQQQSIPMQASPSQHHPQHEPLVTDQKKEKTTSKAGSSFWAPRRDVKKRKSWFKKRASTSISEEPAQPVMKSAHQASSVASPSPPYVPPAPSPHSAPPQPAPPPQTSSLQAAPSQHQPPVSSPNPSNQGDTLQTPFSTVPVPSQTTGYFVYYPPAPPPPPPPAPKQPELPKGPKITMSNPRSETNDRCLIM
ncbi:hypothetical protein DM01DRAFT_1343128 [Hesseltinella vesiculosa]|uniref:Uncharacterized protein n=1 Tax=Hesseltinella vesiculosa TaxID=101127 RepID=A0A1X2GTB3_9FUNG|nr:hypothetical protein DM01DRAFT_1343128 [Hesseltinella vesiculosa]